MKGYVVTRKWGGEVKVNRDGVDYPLIEYDESKAVHVSIVVCATCCVLSVPSVAIVKPLEPRDPSVFPPRECARCGEQVDS